MSDPNFPPPPGGTPPPPPPPPGGTPPPPPPPGGTPPPPPPPPGGTPPPPPGGYGGGQYGAPPPGGGQEPAQLDLGAALQYGWKKFTENAGPLIVLFIVIAVITAVLAFIFALLQADADVVISSTRIRVRPTFIGMIWNTALNVVLVGVLLAIGSTFLRAILGITRGEAVTQESVTKTDNLVPYMITVVIISLVPVLIEGFVSWLSWGLGLLLTPVFILWHIVMVFAPMMALDKGTEPIEALKKSAEWVTGDIGRMGVIALVGTIISVIGFAVCGVGILVSMPVGTLALVYAYRARNNEMVAS